MLKWDTVTEEEQEEQQEEQEQEEQDQILRRRWREEFRELKWDSITKEEEDGILVERKKPSRAEDDDGRTVPQFTASSRNE